MFAAVCPTDSLLTIQYLCHPIFLLAKKVAYYEFATIDAQLNRKMGIHHLHPVSISVRDPIDHILDMGRKRADHRFLLLPYHRSIDIHAYRVLILPSIETVTSSGIATVFLISFAIFHLIR